MAEEKTLEREDIVTTLTDVRDIETVVRKFPIFMELLNRCFNKFTGPPQTVMFIDDFLKFVNLRLQEELDYVSDDEGLDPRNVLLWKSYSLVVGCFMQEGEPHWVVFQTRGNRPHDISTLATPSDNTITIQLINLLNGNYYSIMNIDTEVEYRTHSVGEAYIYSDRMNYSDPFIPSSIKHVIPPKAMFIVFEPSTVRHSGDEFDDESTQISVFLKHIVPKEWPCDVNWLQRVKSEIVNLSLQETHDEDDVGYAKKRKPSAKKAKERSKRRTLGSKLIHRVATKTHRKTYKTHKKPRVASSKK